MYYGDVEINAGYLGNYQFYGEDPLPWVLASDNDFSGTSNGQFRYIGNDPYVEIPHVIKGVNVTSYASMFRETSVIGVKSTNQNIKDMNRMFWNSSATSLDLNSFNTSSVTNMYAMFWNSSATSLDLNSFNTSSVANMRYMFGNSSATSLDLSSFDTSSISNMYMVSDMFQNSKATTGYARTQREANTFNNTLGKPSGLTFVVKEGVM